MNQITLFFKRYVYLSTAVGVVTATAFGDTNSLLDQIDTARRSGSVSNLIALTGSVDSLLTNNAALYFHACDQLGVALEPLGATNGAALQALQSLCESALERQCPTNFADADSSFRSKSSIARRFAEAFPSRNIRYAEILADFLREVRAMLNPNYKPLLPHINIAPPIHPTNSNGEPTFTFVGMNPKSISDPKARTAYEKAIAESAERGSENYLQTRTLPEVNADLSHRFIDYSRKLLAQDPARTKEAARLAELAHLTPFEQQMICGTVSAVDMQNYWVNFPRMR
jgi:hypothetical protein